MDSRRFDGPLESTVAALTHAGYAIELRLAPGEVSLSWHDDEGRRWGAVGATIDDVVRTARSWCAQNAVAIKLIAE